MAEWACVLCKAGGRESGPRWNSRSAICADHQATLKAQGRAWCGRGRHVVPAERIASRQSWCKACDAARKRSAPATKRPRAALNAYQRAYYQRNRDACVARVKRRKVAHLLDSFRGAPRAR